MRDRQDEVGLSKQRRWKGQAQIPRGFDEHRQHDRRAGLGDPNAPTLLRISVVHCAKKGRKFADLLMRHG